MSRVGFMALLYGRSGASAQIRDNSSCVVSPEKGGLPERNAAVLRVLVVPLNKMHRRPNE